MRRKKTKRNFALSMYDLVIALCLTVSMLLLAYRDIIYLRFKSGFVSDFSLESDAFQQFLANGLANKVSTNLNTYSPIILLTIFGIITVYSTIESYKKSKLNLEINDHYINAIKKPLPKVIGQFIALRSLAFVVPVSFWTIYVFVWLPALSKAPLGQLTSGSLTRVGLSFGLVFIILWATTHVGILMSRLAFRYLRT